MADSLAKRPYGSGSVYRQGDRWVARLETTPTGRRRRGAGGIHCRADGRWEAAFTRPGAGPQSRRRRKRTVATYEEALAALEALRAEEARRVSVEGIRQRVRAALPAPDRKRTMTREGYLVVWEKGRAIKEHKLVMEAVLERPLRPGESVHHRNGIRHDNRPENLELWVGGVRYGQRAVDLFCGNCGHPYLVESNCG